MLKSVHYGPHTFNTWCAGTGYVDKEAKSLKSFRSREPSSIWQSLDPKNEELGEYELYICRHCLLYSSTKKDITVHEHLCRYYKCPPGETLYEDENFIIKEVQASVATAAEDPLTGVPPVVPDDEIEHFDSIKLYLQCLSLFGHLFLETKSISFSVDAFRFYTAIDRKSGMVAGFFSKEIHSWYSYNLACIVIFPPWQKHGLGQLLISFSYLLSRYANMTGSPEKPLSKYGQLAYDAYWSRQVVRFCASRRNLKKVTLRDISHETGIEVADLVSMLKRKGAVDGDKLKLSKLVCAKKN